MGFWGGSQETKMASAEEGSALIASGDSGTESGNRVENQTQGELITKNRAEMETAKTVTTIITITRIVTTIITTN